MKREKASLSVDVRASLNKMSLSKGVSSDGRLPEVVVVAFFSFLSSDFAQIFGQIASVRVKTLSNTDFVASRFIKREKVTLPVAVHGSKKPLLKQRLHDAFLGKTRGIQA